MEELDPYNIEELDQSFKISYAQNREDIILDYFFKDVSRGFYVDVGAGHPEEDSVTKLFYDKGWRGINIEPIKRVYNLIQKSRPRDTNLNIGLSDKKGKLLFREYENYGQSTFTVDMKEEYQSSLGIMNKYEDYEVQVDTLANVLNQQEVKHINFLKIDVEGLENEVLEGNDWRRYRPDVLCVEANHIFKDWRPLLSTNGYTKVFNDGLNDYYLAKEFSRVKSFSYVAALLSDVRPLDYRVANVFNKEIAILNSKIVTYISKDAEKYLMIDQLEHEVNKLNSHLSNYQSIRPLIKALFARVSLKIEEHIYPSKYRKQLTLPRDAKLALHNEVHEQLKEINEYDKIYLTKIKVASHPVRAYELGLYRKTKHLAIRIIRTRQRVMMKIKKIIPGR